MYEDDEEEIEMEAAQVSLDDPSEILE